MMAGQAQRRRGLGVHGEDTALHRRSASDVSTTSGRNAEGTFSDVWRTIKVGRAGRPARDTTATWRRSDPLFALVSRGVMRGILMKKKTTTAKQGSSGGVTNKLQPSGSNPSLHKGHTRTVSRPPALRLPAALCLPLTRVRPLSSRTSPWTPSTSPSCARTPCTGRGGFGWRTSAPCSPHGSCCAPSRTPGSR